MKHYKQLTSEQRYQISGLLKVGLTLPLNSVSLNGLIMRHPSTVPQTSLLTRLTRVG